MGKTARVDIAQQRRGWSAVAISLAPFAIYVKYLRN